jgi:hypothetical protein
LRKNVLSYVDIEATGVAAWQAAATIFLSLDEGNQAKKGQLSGFKMILTALSFTNVLATYI